MSARAVLAGRGRQPLAEGILRLLVQVAPAVAWIHRSAGSGRGGDCGAGVFRLGAPTGILRLGAPIPGQVIEVLFFLLLGFPVPDAHLREGTEVVFLPAVTVAVAQNLPLPQRYYEYSQGMLVEV